MGQSLRKIWERGGKGEKSRAEKVRESERECEWKVGGLNAGSCVLGEDSEDRGRPQSPTESQGISITATVGPHHAPGRVLNVPIDEGTSKKKSVKNDIKIYVDFGAKI